MSESKFSLTGLGEGDWPVYLDRKAQKVVVLGLASSIRGVSIGRLQETLITTAYLAKTKPVISGVTKPHDTKKGRGYIDQWFTSSWVPKGCRIEKSKNYNYCIKESRVRIVGITRVAKEKLKKAQDTVEKLCLT